MAHVFIEVGKSKIHRWVGRLETERRADTAVPMHKSSAAEFFLAQKRSVFCSIQNTLDWMRPTHTLESDLLYSKFQFKCYSHPKTLLQAYPQKIFIHRLGLCGPAKLTHKINHDPFSSIPPPTSYENKDNGLAFTTSNLSMKFSFIATFRYMVP